MTPGARPGESRPSDVRSVLSELRRTAPDTPLIDLSLGSPVDPPPAVAQEALCAGGGQSGYPQTRGTEACRASSRGWMQEHGVTGVGLDHILPVIGTKEFISTLPTVLGLGPRSLVGQPDLAYPTYRFGADLVGARILATDSLTSFGPERPDLLWINSPSNPTGKILPPAHLRKVVEWCRHRGTILVSDECYLEFGWTEKPYSILDPDICGDSTEGLLAVHSLSKRSNLANYRCGFVAGDATLIERIGSVRMQMGLQLPGPQQAVLSAALDDDHHVQQQREIYRRRRDLLAAALTKAGFRIDHSEGGIYLWITREEDADETAAWFMRLGILVVPGYCYGPRGSQHVRVALTVPDLMVEQVVLRLETESPQR